MHSAAESSNPVDAQPLSFAPFPLPPRLFAPVLGGRAFDVLPPGTPVLSGDSLLQGAPLQASCRATAAGTVVARHRAVLTNGRAIDAVELETMPSSSPPASLEPAPAARVKDLPDWITRFCDGGVDAERSNSPALLTQLRLCRTIGIDTLICSLLDVDPNLPVNSTSARVHAAALAAGIELLTKITGAQRAIVVVNPSMPAHDLAELNPLVGSRHLQLVELPDDYPQADPTLLMHTLLGRRLKPRRPPVERGALLLDAAAAVAVGELALHDRPMRSVPLAFRDRVAGLTYLLDVPVGTRLADVCGWIGAPVQTSVFRGGDWLRDCVLPPSAVVGAGELAIHLATREPAVNPSPCIRCGWCMDACPTRVHPARLLEASQRNDPALAEQFGLSACIECGICSYVCPSRLPLLSAIRSLKIGNCTGE